MPRSHIMLPPYGHRKVLRSTIGNKTWFLKTVRSCGPRLLWSQMLRQLHDDRTIHEIKNREVTARRPGGDRTATSQFLQLLQVCRTAAVRAPWGRRKNAVRPPYDFLGTQDRVKTVCYFTAIARRPYGHRKMTLRCGCGIAVSEKKFNVNLRKNAGLAMTLRRAKNREVAVQFA